MKKKYGSLSLFHPLIAQWFSKNIGTPTDVQQQAWPEIAAGEHVLITAPTGSGKTLTAFLWAINRLITGYWTEGQTRVLYVSPLKALNNDIYRNLLAPLAMLRKVFEEGGKSFPSIRVGTRSGDTSQSDRRAMVRHPPEILITTPESLNLLLSSRSGQSVLTGLKTVIMDEIHALVGNKRGVHLITAVDRLVILSGEFQRIALSATIRPIETVAQYIGGFRLQGAVDAPRYTARNVKPVTSRSSKQYDIQVRFPEKDRSSGSKGAVWEYIVDEVKNRITKNRATLIFVNSRRFCEKMTLKINSGEEGLLAYAHHGSLSREIRKAVEERLKAGDLKAIVATNSLELGIDIGELDEVVLFQAPKSVSSAIQRVGRAGHRVGEVSCGILFPTHTQDLLEAAVLSPSIVGQELEEIKTVNCPLDVLAQILVSMTGMETWDMDELYTWIRTSFPFHLLSRTHFDIVLNMLSGRYADSRIRELNPRVSIDRMDNNVAARKGALLALYMSGGTIPDRGYFRLRHHKTGGIIGELDEEFVWERTLGDAFTLGTQQWRIERITHNDVTVSSAGPRAKSTPFWKAEEMNRDFHFSTLIGAFLEEVNDRLDAPDLVSELINRRGLNQSGAKALIAFLSSQQEHTGCSLPHRHHIVLEWTQRGPDSVPGNQLIIHTFWGGRVNRPFSVALEAAWQEKTGQRPELYSSNDCIILQLPDEIPGEELLSMVTANSVEELIRKHLGETGFFGARFRECAGRALLLTRNRINERVPLWMNRLKSKKIMDAVSRFDDFPIMLETWRTCLQDEFDLQNLNRVLGELESGAVTWTEVRTATPSPMGRAVAWRQIEEYMYMPDAPGPGKKSRLSSDLIHELVQNPELRPAVSRALADRFSTKRQRIFPGYSPSSIRDLLDWIKERVIIPEPDWKSLMEAMGRDQGEEYHNWVNTLEGKVARIHPANAPHALIVSMERIHDVIQCFYPAEEINQARSLSSDVMRPIEIPAGLQDSRSEKNGHSHDLLDDMASTLLGEWLSFYGPLTIEDIHQSLGLDPEYLAPVLGDLLDRGLLISGTLVEDGQDMVCDSENFNRLLRLSRAEALPEFEPLALEDLPLFIATHHGIVNKRDIQDERTAIQNALEAVLCYPLPVELWETEYFPARLPFYGTTGLERVIREGDLRWIGMERNRLAFCFDSDLDLLMVRTDGEESEAIGTSNKKDDQPKEGVEIQEKPSDLLPSGEGRYDFSTLMKITGLRPARLTAELWERFWKGEVSNDSFLSIRRGIENQFQIPDMGERVSGSGSRRSRFRGRYGGRSGFSRWKNALPNEGNWYRIPWPDISEDPLEKEERNKERVRVVMDRYGILFKDLLQRELPLFQWSRLFRTLRIMELSGEILAGYFFHGIPGPQFISHKAFQRLQRQLPKDEVWWVNATDPASLCGISIDSIRQALPQRREGSHMVYHGNRLVMVSESKGKRLTFLCKDDDPDLPRYMGPIHHLLNRPIEPLRKITIETINEVKAPHSPYVDSLRTDFDVEVDYKLVILYRS